MPIETIRYVVTGANPQTSSIQVTCDNNGNGTGTVSLNSGSSGVDTVQAFLDAFNLKSNQAQVVWQGANGPISISPISCYYGGTQSTGLVPSGYTAANFAAPQTFNSLMFNTHPASLLPGDPHSSGNQANPMVNNAITASGYYSADVAVSGDPGGGILLSLVGQFVVAHAGQVSFVASDNASFIIGVSGASFVSGAATLGGVTHTPVKNYNAIAGRNGSWPGGNVATDTFTLNFPTPGVYNFEIFFASGPATEREFCLLANNAVIPPASMVPVPPAPAPGSGQMVLTPNAAGPDITGTTQSFTIQITGLKFASQPYMPVLAGTSGHVLIANDSGDNGFSFPALPNGGSVDPTAAIPSVFSMSGDNGSWQSRISISWDGTDYRLNYNGSAPDRLVEKTTLTITNADIAWYNPAKNAFDVFGVTSQGGGSQAQIILYWLVNPTISSESPSTISANGGIFHLVFTFANPLPPLQNNTTATFTAGTGFTVQSSVANFDANGWLLGFTATVQTNTSASNVTSSIGITVAGSVEFLSGTSFVTQNVTYINNQVFALTLTGTGTTGGFGGGGGNTCPAIEMLVGPGAAVADIEVGDTLDCLSENYQIIERHPVQAMAFAESECMRFVTANGAEVIVSVSTPVPSVETVYAIQSGVIDKDLLVLATQIKPGMHLFTEVDGTIEVSEAVIVEHVGVRKVGHVSVGGRNFAAGAVVGRRIFTHNVSPVLGK